MSPPRRKTLTAKQVEWLSRITAEGITEGALLDLRGKAKNWDGRYRQSLAAAVEAHNEGRAQNSPLPRVPIDYMAVGPRGGNGYRLRTDPAVELAEQVLAKERNAR